MIVDINLKSLHLQQLPNCLPVRSAKRSTPKNYPALRAGEPFPGQVAQIIFKLRLVHQVVVEASNQYLSLRYQKRNLMESFSFIIFIVIWFVLQKWILPKLGVQTWMSSNNCRVPTDTKNKAKESHKEDPNDPPNH